VVIEAPGPAVHPSRSGGGLAARLRGPVGDRLFMGASVLIRIGVGLLVFIVLARGLGPEQFGLFSTVFAYAMLAGFVTDFGFSVKALRDVAADPANGARSLSEALTVKCLLTVAVMAVGGVIIALLPVDAAAKTACALLGAAVLIGSIAELSQVAFRSVGRFAAETWIVAWTSGAHVVILVGLVMAGAGVVGVSAGFLASRVLYLIIAVIGAQRLFPGQRLRFAGAGRTLEALRKSRAWAADAGLGYLSGQIDGLMVAHLLGLTAAGLYQSGGRFVQTALGLGSILSNIHIPRLASRGAASGAVEWRMIVEFVIFGLLFGAFFVLAGPLITRFVLGSQYQAVDALWPGFAAFIAARYLAAAFGAALSASARPMLRVGGQLAGLIVIVAGFFVVLPRFGLPAGPWIMAAGAAVTAVAYVVGSMLPTGRSKP
jgi:O-antigen/teichoic acid export membrane protein